MSMSKESPFCSAAEEAPQTHSNWHVDRPPLAKTDRELRMESLLQDTAAILGLYVKISKLSLKCMILPAREELEPEILKAEAQTTKLLGKCESILSEK